MIAVASTLASLAAVALLSGGGLGGEQPGLNFPSGGYERFIEVREAVAARFGPVRHAIPAWQWLTPFVATSALFLLVAALLLVADPTSGWVDVALVAYAVVASAGRTIGGFIPEALAQVVEGRYGLATLFTGNTRRILEVLPLPGGEAIVRAVEPDLGAGMSAVALWTLIGLGALAIMLRGRREC